MSSVIVLKIKYGDTLRRFSVTASDDEHLDINMDGLRAKICSLFKFPDEADFTLTYVDEDADEVVLGDDEDLHDVVRQYLNPVRITVKWNTGMSVPSSSLSRPNQVPDFQPNDDVRATKYNVEEHKFLPSLTKDPESSWKENICYLPGSSAASAPQETEEKPNEACTAKQAKEVKADSATSSRCVKTRIQSTQVSDIGKTAGDFAASVNHPDASASFHQNLSSSAQQNWSWRPIPGLPIGHPAWLRKEDIGSSDQSHATERSSLLRSSIPNDCPFSGIPMLPSPPAQVPVHPSSMSYSDVAIFHGGVYCAACGVHPITGPRYKSKLKENYDLCSICFARAGIDADYIRMDLPAPYSRPWSIGRSSNPMISPGWAQMLRPPTGLQRKLDSCFVRDVNVVDGTIMAPGTFFTKIWRMSNNGTLSWPLGTQMIWIGGDRFSTFDSSKLEIPANGVPLEGELDIAVNFVAPELPGRYISYWRMMSPLGQKFGQRVWVLIHVDDSLKESPYIVAKSFDLNQPPAGSDRPQSVKAYVEARSGSNHDPGKSSNAAEKMEKPLVGESLPAVDLNSATGSRHSLDDLTQALAASMREQGDDLAPLLSRGANLLTPAFRNIPWGSSSVSQPTSSFSFVSAQDDFPPLCPTASNPLPLMSNPCKHSPILPPISTSSLAFKGCRSNSACGSSSLMSATSVVGCQTKLGCGSDSSSFVPLGNASSSLVSYPTNHTVVYGPSNAPTSEVHPTILYPLMGSIASPRVMEVRQGDTLGSYLEHSILKEQSLLKELNNMGFTQVGLNVDILRKNGYNLELALDELCGVSEWDTILEELQEMGFYDMERNKKLLAKYKGSLKLVVMDLLIGERA